MLPTRLGESIIIAAKELTPPEHWNKRREASKKRMELLRKTPKPHLGVQDKNHPDPYGHKDKELSDLIHHHGKQGHEGFMKHGPKYEKAKEHGDWWDSMNAEEHQEYIKQHPNSKYAKGKK